MIYLLLLLVVLIGGKVIKNSKIYCIMCSILIILIIGLRSYQLGLNDTNALYVPYFKHICNLDFKNLLNFIKLLNTEYGFYIVSYFISKITTNVTLYLLIISSVTYGLLGRFIFKFSKNTSLSFIMLLSLNYFGYGFYMVRHMMALSILTLSYENLVKDKKINSIFWIVVASLFHKSALIFLFIFIFSKININKKLYIPITILTILLVKLFGNSILNIIYLNIVNEGHFSYYVTNGRGDTITLLLINMSLLLFLRFFSQNKNKIDEINYKSQIIATVLSTFVLYLSEFMRLASFFSVYSIVSIPNAIADIKNKSLKVSILIGLYLVMIVYFYFFSLPNNNINVYKFFWEI